MRLRRGGRFRTARPAIAIACRALTMAADLRFHLFALLFALGTIHHEVQFILEQQQTGPLTGYMERWSQVKPSVGWPSEVGILFHLANTLISVFILALPCRRALLCLLAIPFFLSILASPERISSHTSVMAAALAMILVLGMAESAGRVGQQGREGAPATDWYGWTLTGLVWLCGLTYGATFVHKLNPVFLSPWESPAVKFNLPTAEWLGLSHPTAAALTGYPAILGALAIEGSLPLLLLWRRTRLCGCLLGVLFHLLMMAQAIFDFPTILLAFYPLFFSLPEAENLLAECLAPPSPARLASAAAVSSAGLAAMQRADQLNWLHSKSPGVEPLVVYAHLGLMCGTFILFAYVASSLAAMLLDHRVKRAPIRAPA